MIAVAQLHFEVGKLAEAEAMCRAMLAADANDAAALHLLGLIAHRAGKSDLGLQLITRAMAIRPEVEQLHNSLGCILHAQGRHQEAIAAFGQALGLKPDYVAARANLGNTLMESGRWEEAVASYRAAIAARPDYAFAHNNLGTALAQKGQWEEAMQAYRAAIAAMPNYVDARYHLANALVEAGQLEAATVEYRALLAIAPDHADALGNLGNALMWQGQLTAAVTAFRQAIAVNPDYPPAHNNLGNALKDQGEIGAAVECYRRSLRLKPDDALVHSNLVYTLPFLPGADPQAAREEQESWNRRHAAPLSASRPAHTNPPDPSRRLKVGFVSPEFHVHAVSYFLLPLLEALDPAECEVHCYASVWKPDALTERFRRCAPVWRDVFALSDEALAERMRADGIDIAVDLSMHSGKNRLLAFARKPAPVQVSWLAYPGGSGVEAVDYRLTDAQMDPPDGSSAPPCERPVRLPDGWCCYEPVGVFPEVSTSPAQQSGAVTFGSLNNFCKVNEAVLECWAGVLASVADARLLLLCPEGNARERVRTIFAKRGVDGERIEMTVVRCWEEYIAQFQRIDLCLDPFPCNGMTTTCHALWMGVPVVTQYGAAPVSRAGLSLLTTIGLAELAADSTESYTAKVVELARDIPRLAALRATLRERMSKSPLMNAPRFARSFEHALRGMWQEWCGTQRQP